MKKRKPFRWKPAPKKPYVLVRKKLSLLSMLASIRMDDSAEIRMLKRELLKKKRKATHPGRRSRLKKRLRDEGYDGG